MRLLRKSKKNDPLFLLLPPLTPFYSLLLFYYTLNNIIYYIYRGKTSETWFCLVSFGFCWFLLLSLGFVWFLLYLIAKNPYFSRLRRNWLSGFSIKFSTFFAIISAETARSFPSKNRQIFAIFPRFLKTRKQGFVWFLLLLFGFYRFPLVSVGFLSKNHRLSEKVRFLTTIFNDFPQKVVVRLRISIHSFKKQDSRKARFQPVYGHIIKFIRKGSF